MSKKIVILTIVFSINLYAMDSDEFKASVKQGSFQSNMESSSGYKNVKKVSAEQFRSQVKSGSFQKSFDSKLKGKSVGADSFKKGVKSGSFQRQFDDKGVSRGSAQSNSNSAVSNESTNTVSQNDESKTKVLRKQAGEQKEKKKLEKSEYINVNSIKLDF